MKGSHCLEGFHEGQARWSVTVGSNNDGTWLLRRLLCPACQQYVFYLEIGASAGLAEGQQNAWLSLVNKSLMVWPKGISRSPVPNEVPTEIVDDYKEACLVLADSPKASAALSRRCLQNLLRRAAAVTPGDLSKEIDQVLESGKLPTDIAENIDPIRNIANFAAHPHQTTLTES